MFLEALSALILGGGLIKDKIEQNEKYYGTERDIFKDNPKAQANRKAVDDIIARCRAEYIERTGHDW